MLALTMIANNENAEACSSCGGKCCQRMPGTYHPDDLGGDEAAIEKRLRQKLAQGTVCFDRWEGDPRPDAWDEEACEQKDWALSCTWYPRPRGKDVEGEVIDLPWRSRECQHFTPVGCELCFQARPLQCRALVPNHENPGTCRFPDDGLTQESPTYSKQALAIAWIPYQGLLKKLIEEFDI